MSSIAETASVDLSVVIVSWNVRELLSACLDSCLKPPDSAKLNRLTLAVSLLYVRLVALGVELTKCGRAREVDRPDRRDLSYFRRGFDFLKRCLALKEPILPGFFPDFNLLYGG